MNRKILCVDDDQNILTLFRLQFAKEYELECASNGSDGLVAVQHKGPFAVVVSDLRMPRMDGIAFLSKVKQLAPATVRIMLTGHAEVKAAIDAVNQDNVFRFLTKPCTPDMLKMVIASGLEQYRLVTLEKDILEKTLSGSIQVLTDIISLLNPEAFSRATRIRRYARQIAEKMGLPNVWQIELAAMLSQLGCITLPKDVLHKVYFHKSLTEQEQQLYDGHPAIAATLLAQIPHLEIISRMIAGQNQTFPHAVPRENMSTDEKVALGAQIIKCCQDYDGLRMQGKFNKPAMPTARVREMLLEIDPHGNPVLLDAIEHIRHEQVKWATQYLHVRELGDFMVIDEDVQTKDNQVVIQRGQEVTDTVRQVLRTHERSVGIKEPFRVIVMKS
jgi:response regulator RpfG family c-di-GMP phosphodiesterase